VDLSGDPELRTGREVYNGNCARCHGPEGGGGVGNKLSDGVVVARFPDIEDQIAVITKGIGSMPAWEGTLSPDEIRAVARYEREVL
jgi:cytochrome c oxidase cbb3-type subunit 3